VPLSETCRLARALAHDVGKYVARTARNVPDGGWTTELASMLASDLYDVRGERALRIFLRLAPADSSPLVHFSEWTAAYDLLLDLDAMESDVRAGNLTVLQKAAHQALQVERALHELLLRTQSDLRTCESKGRSA
jgi:hypothetical protein